MSPDESHKNPRWTSYEETLLKTLIAEGMTPEQVHGYIPTHTPGAIRKRGYELGVSRRRPGSNRGLVIGQPRAVSLKVEGLARYRELILAGKVRPAAVAARLELVSRTGAELCPLCGTRPVALPSRSKPAALNGVCVVCHIRGLVEVQNEELEALEARRELLVAWQRKSRLKRELGER